MTDDITKRKMASLTSDWSLIVKGSASIVFGYGQVGRHAEKRLARILSRLFSSDQ